MSYFIIYQYSCLSNLILLIFPFSLNQLIQHDIFYGTGWYVFVRIEADDISYKNIGSVREPSKIIRLKMAK